MPSLQEINTIINQRALRERVLLFLVALAVVYFIWDSLVMSSLLGSKKAMSNSARKLRNQITQLESQIAGITNNLRSDPARELKDKIARLRSENLAIEENISKLTAQLIAPEQMSKVLANILAQDEGLIVAKMENLAEQPVFEEPENEEQFEQALARFQVYKHGLILEFTGTYFETQQFLNALEFSPWKLLWDELSYQVSTYPLAKVSITVYTLSLDKNWMAF